MNVLLIVGVIFILMGISVLIKLVFNVDIPLFKIAFAGFLIYLGIKVLVGGNFHIFNEHQDEETVVFGEKKATNLKSNKEYNVIFGSGVFDLSHYEFPDSTDVHVKLNTIFGGSKLILNKNIPVQISASSVFGGAIMPDGNSAAFGSVHYKSGGDTLVSSPTLYIETNTIFGGLKVIRP